MSREENCRILRAALEAPLAEEQRVELDQLMSELNYQRRRLQLSATSAKLVRNEAERQGSVAWNRTTQPNVVDRDIPARASDSQMVSNHKVTEMLGDPRVATWGKWTAANRLSVQPIKQGLKLQVIRGRDARLAAPIQRQHGE